MRLSKKDIEKMKKIMKTVPIVEAKTELNHELDAREADKLLEKIRQGTVKAE
jgi:hypothetical protein